MSLDLSQVSVTFLQGKQKISAVRGVSLSLKKRERIALVGESGSGKSALAKTALKLHYRHNTNITGEITLDGKPILETDRGKKIGFVFQDPINALNPTMKIGKQIAECLPKSRRDEVVKLLQEVKISRPEERVRQYPHELSGGMCQRVMLAIALASEPDYLIMDEPTTALDSQTQKDVLDLVLQIQEERGMGILLITHDLNLAATYTEEILVMYAGKIVERGPAKTILSHPKHPYTISLIGSIPKKGQKLTPIPGEPPDPRYLPQGCAFHPRCPKAAPTCKLKEPPAHGKKQLIACYFPDHDKKPLQELQEQEVPALRT
ncbi:MAG: ABC transporter ATP-binding protein [Candidatus Algichlamydia australiensis]|nr:ABC transporter ATP-binding protein [Chlamydiales bacterium]